MLALQLKDLKINEGGSLHKKDKKKNKVEESTEKPQPTQTASQESEAAANSSVDTLSVMSLLFVWPSSDEYSC